MKVEFKGKTYYTIEDLAGTIEVTAKTIKEWENKGHLPKARRHPIRKCRLYTQGEIDKLAQHAKENDYFR